MSHRTEVEGARRLAEHLAEVIGIKLTPEIVEEDFEGDGIEGYIKLDWITIFPRVVGSSVGWGMGYESEIPATRDEPADGDFVMVLLPSKSRKSISDVPTTATQAITRAIRLWVEGRIADATLHLEEA